MFAWGVTLEYTHPPCSGSHHWHIDKPDQFWYQPVLINQQQPEPSPPHLLQVHCQKTKAFLHLFLVSYCREQELLLNVYLYMQADRKAQSYLHPDSTNQKLLKNKDKTSKQQKILENIRNHSRGFMIPKCILAWVLGW